MSSTQQALFWTKCLFCITYIEYPWIHKNCELCCPTCGKLFNAEECQDDVLIQMTEQEEKLAKLEQKLTENDEEILRLKDHSQKLLVKVKKFKERKKKLEEEKECVEKKFNDILS